MPSLNSIFSTDTVDMQVNISTDNFNKCLNICAPLVTKKVKRPFAPWMDDDLRSLIHEKNKILLSVRHDRNNLERREEYKELKKLVRISLHKTMAEYYNKEFGSNRNNMAAM